MNRLLKATTFLTGLAVAAFVAAGPSDARDAIIGLSPAQHPSELQSQAERVIEHLVETLNPGGSALIFDALNLHLIGTFAVPDNPAYANPRAKLQANGEALRSIRTFFEGAEADEGRPGAVDLPGFLRTTRVRYPSDEPRAIIVLGSPIHDDPLAPSLSMADGRVPNDGAIAATSNVSTFSTGDLPGTLEGDQLYFGIVPSASDWSVSFDHAYHVERFWTLSMEAHDGRMGYFGDDLGTLFRLAADGGETAPHPQPLAPTDKLEMIRFFPDQGGLSSRPARESAEAAVPDVDWRNVAGLRVRATWDCASCDLDLYVVPHAGTEALYYGRSRTPEGQLYKELEAGVTNGYEVVVLAGTVDVADLVVGVNLYDRLPSSDASGPVNGAIELIAGGVTHTIPFTLESVTGNRGANWEAMMSGEPAIDPHWTVWDGLGLLPTQ